MRDAEKLGIDYDDPDEYTEVEFLGLDPDAPWWDGIHDYTHNGEDE